MRKRIEELFCFAVIGDDDIEGVISFYGSGGHLPLVGADLERMNSLRIIAKQTQIQLGKKVRLYRFSNKEEIPWERGETM